VSTDVFSALKSVSYVALLMFLVLKVTKLRHF